MANLDQIQLPDNTSHYTKTIFRGETGSTSTSTAFEVTVSGITSLYDGLTVVIKNTVIASASGCTLNVNGTGAKTIWVSYSNVACTTHWGLNQTYLFIYDLTNDRWELQSGRDRDTDSNTVGEYAGIATAGGGNITQYGLVMQTQLNPPLFASIVTTSSTSTKTKQACGFIPNGKVLYYDGATLAEGEKTKVSDIWITRNGMNLRYSFNISTTTLPATAVGKSIYIKCTKNSVDGKLYLADTTWWATDLPTTQDNFYYVFVGQMQSRYQATLYAEHPIYYHDGTKLQLLLPDEFPSIEPDTWRDITVGGTSWKGTGTDTGALNFVQGSNVTLTNSGNDLTIAATDTTYESKTAASGGTAVSLCTTGEKYTWNNKMDSISLATVATSGSYNDLSDKPTIPTVNNAALTIQKNGTTVKTFTANASSNVTANITVPTATSDLTNDSGFLTSLSGAVLTSASGEQLITTTGAGSGNLNLKNSVIDITKSDNNVSSGTYYYGIYIKDKNGTNVGKSAVGVSAGGLVQYQIYAQNKQSASSSASNINTSISLNQSKSSTRGDIQCDCQYMQINGDTKVTGYLGIGSAQTAGISSSAQNLSFWADGAYPGGNNYRLHLTSAYNTTWAWVPETSGKLALGTSGKKWTVVYANNGTIQTSDRTKKKDIDYDLENFNNFYKELKPVSYKFIDGTSGRTHVGFIAQDVEESLENNDLTALDFAGFCKDQKSKDILDNDGVVIGTEPIEGEYDYSLRYDEFVALNTHMIQKLMNRVDELEATVVSQNRRIIQLEAKVDKLMS